jgi:hypothetical protein
MLVMFLAPEPLTVETGLEKRHKACFLAEPRNSVDRPLPELIRLKAGRRSPALRVYGLRVTPYPPGARAKP